MNRNAELIEAIDEILCKELESEAFKRRFKRLVENAVKDEYRDDDIMAVMDLIRTGGER